MSKGLRVVGTRLGVVGHTGDVLVKDVIFLEDIVDDLFGVLVDDQDHPLLKR